MKIGTPKSLGPAIMLAARLHRARMGEALAGIGLFPGQETLLQALADRAENDPPGMAIGELARFLHVRPPTISKAVARLAAQGLVARQAHPRDGIARDARLVRVTLTAGGEAKLARIEEIAGRMEEEIVERLGEKDAKRLRKLLRRLAKGFASRTEPDRAAEEPGADASGGGD